MPWPMWPICEVLGACQHFRTDTGSFGLCWGKEEQIAFVHAPLMTGIMVSHNSEIPASKGNLVSSVQASGTGNTLSALAG